VEVYALTELGRKVARDKQGDGDEMRVLHFIRDHKTATNEELGIVADSYVVKHLVREGLAKKLTT